MQAVARPRRPIRCRQRTRASRRAMARTSSAVPSRESSSTKIASHGVAGSAAASRASSGSTLPRSFMVGMTMVKRVVAAVAAVSTKGPSEIVTSIAGSSWAAPILRATCCKGANRVDPSRPERSRRPDRRCSIKSAWRRARISRNKPGHNAICRGRQHARRGVGGEPNGLGVAGVIAVRRDKPEPVVV